MNTWISPATNPARTTIMVSLHSRQHLSDRLDLPRLKLCFERRHPRFRLVRLWVANMGGDPVNGTTRVGPDVGKVRAAHPAALPAGIRGRRWRSGEAMAAGTLVVEQLPRLGGGWRQIGRRRRSAFLTAAGNDRQHSSRR